jgi:hypothetical protein
VGRERTEVVEIVVNTVGWERTEVVEIVVNTVGGGGDWENVCGSGVGGEGRRGRQEEAGDKSRVASPPKAPTASPGARASIQSRVRVPHSKLQVNEM